ncbi:hypothetical protein EV44_g3223 [Erysiphe necator]|uniref:CCHC-type domain-containing protein n=1 Tax=Uncinula necator TaxID=52586 RepID=A0A0B1P680_UNCNE|nr:hypothetical protein EV44_g3223 [Erysiphe necator]
MLTFQDSDDEPDDIGNSSYSQEKGSSILGLNWDKKAINKSSQLDKSTILDWDSFKWKPHPSSYLKGISNWSAYKDALLLQLECVGYEAGIKLTRLDELKLAAVIQRTTMPEAGALVSGMKSGTNMMRLFEATYQQIGEVQQESLWEAILAVKYTGACPVEYVTKFKTSVRSYKNAGGELGPKQISTLFKQSVKEKAGRWHGIVTALARFQSWSTEQLYQDFVSHHFERIGRQERRDKNASFKEPIKKSLNNAQDSNLNSDSTSKKGFSASKSNKKVRCYKCKEMGHFSSNCPKRSKKGVNVTQNSGAVLVKDLDPPQALTGEYCTIPEEEANSYNYMHQVDHRVYDSMVTFVESELARRRGESVPIIEPLESENPGAEIKFTQQVLSARSDGTAEI